MIKLIYIDLDGTLLNDDKILTQKTKDTIKEVMSKGYHVGIATGRAYELAKPFAEELNIKMPLILNNGSLIKDPVTNKILYQKHLDNQALKPFLDYANKHNIGASFYAEDAFYTNDPLRIDYYKRWNLDYPQSTLPIIEKLDENIIKDHPFYKLLLVIHDEAQMLDAFKYFSETETFNITQSLDIFFDVLPKDTSKGSALKFILDRFDIKKEHVLVFGDQLNDVEMFQEALHSVAMPDSPKRLKEFAKRIALDDHNHDGVAKTLEQFLVHKIL